MPRAFDPGVGTGSREENASIKKESAFAIQSKAGAL
jgi:hypothetical protein